ncbi:MAG: type I DNA topoisomerase [bacterium]|nr:type I DNA topoisomerase [bacterium]
MKTLVIVESPKKAKTISSFLGSEYVVESSYGHIRDLPKSKLGVDKEKGFEPQYEIPEKAKPVVSSLKKEVKKAETVVLATDGDREGEAIAFHLKEALGIKQPKRIIFHEITKEAIQSALENPRDIDEKLVNAQQARRVLDRLVGYELSPLLWKKVRPGLSAGRVQSVALRLVVEREREIKTFDSLASFRVAASFLTDKNKEVQAELLEKLNTEEQAKTLLSSIANTLFHVTGLEQSPATKNPLPPFTTSTLQQEASRLMGFSVKLTMRVAQQLYESGQITYMRTDSVNLSESFLKAAEQTITKKYGKEYHQSRRYATKTKGAQEAHEAIRPTDMAREVASGDERAKKLYNLIYGRAMASQMASARLERTKVEISNGTHTFHAKGEIITFEGFLKAVPKQAKEIVLPLLKTGQEMILKEALARQTFTRPPARYTEATLVRTLEEKGIGRPSTYAPTISTIQDRTYVEKGEGEGIEREARVLTLQKGEVTLKTELEKTGADKGKLIPTELGMIVSDFLTKNFEKVVDYTFTANVEKELDEIALGKEGWREMISSFYKDFQKDVEEAKQVSREEAGQTREIGEDPVTGRPVLVRIGRYGPMVQLGKAEDEEKPKFAPLPPNTTMENVTLEQALAMLSLPRTIGKVGAEEVVANVGRFGPYVKLGKTYASIPAANIFSITLEEAKEALEKKKEEKAGRLIKEFAEEGISILNGRFGPYITDGSKNAKIPKGEKAEDITKEQAQNLLSEAPARRARRRKRAS